MQDEHADIFKRGIAAGIGAGILTNLGKKYGIENLKIALLALEKNKGKVRCSGAWVSWFLKTMKSDHAASQIIDAAPQPTPKKRTGQEAIEETKIDMDINSIFTCAYATTNPTYRAQLIAKLPEKYQEIIRKSDLLNQ